MSLGIFGQAGDDHLYRNTLYPSIFVPIFSSIVFVIGARLQPQNAALAIAGATVFFKFYNTGRLLRDSRPFYRNMFVPIFMLINLLRPA